MPMARQPLLKAKKTADRKLTHHSFAGPDHSIIHPGIFPHNQEAVDFATLSEWLEFDYKAGWGTDEFEDHVSEDHEFPERWSDLDDRLEAHEIITEQIQRLDHYMELRTEGFAQWLSDCRCDHRKGQPQRH